MNNLKQARKKARLTQKQVAEHIGISQNTYSYWENGRNNIDSDSIKRLADLFSVSVDYLLGREDAGMPQSNIVPLSESSVRGVKIPVLGSVPAGTPIEAHEDIVDHIDIPESWLAGGNRYFGLVVHGDSMYPEYLDGDIIVIRIQEDCENGDDCVVYVNGYYDATFKRVEKLKDGSIRLKPVNPSYSPVTYSPEQVTALPVKIAGVAVELRRKMR